MTKLIKNEIFRNTETAFSNRSDKELKKIYFLFKMMNNPFLSNVGTYVLKLSMFLNLPVYKLAKKHLFFHFCAGTTLQESQNMVNELYKYNVKSILDYSAEGKTSEKDFEDILKELKKTIDNVANNKEKLPFAVYKMSGIGDVNLMKKIQSNKSLTEKEKIAKENLLRRVDSLIQYSCEKKVPIMVDAEKVDVQDFIDDITNQMMIKYNKNETIVYNTIQFYRKDSLDRLKKHFNKVTKNNAYYGLKAVRGAYYDEEKSEAIKSNKSSPVNDTKPQTDKQYNEALEFCVKNIDKISLFTATHNEESVNLLIDLMKENNIGKNDKRIYFTQLYGMSEHITFNIAKLGYNVSKYIPYGPVKLVLPYLIRRADENKSMQGQASREFKIIKEEMKRRNLI